LAFPEWISRCGASRS